MKLLGPTRHARLNEAAAILYLLIGIGFTLCLLSYHPADPSWNTASSVPRPQNLIGHLGAYTSDFLFQLFGQAAYALPALIALVAWRWLRSAPIPAPWLRLAGALLLLLGGCTLLALLPAMPGVSADIAAGGLVGLLAADMLLDSLNATGALLATAGLLVISLYLISTWTLAHLTRGAMLPVSLARAVPAYFRRRAEAEQRRRDEQRRRREAEQQERQRQDELQQQVVPAVSVVEPSRPGRIISMPASLAEPTVAEPAFEPHYWAPPAPVADSLVTELLVPQPLWEPVEPEPDDIPIVPLAEVPVAAPIAPEPATTDEDLTTISDVPDLDWAEEDIPIRALEDLPPPAPALLPPARDLPPWEEPAEVAVSPRPISRASARRPAFFGLPPHTLLQEPPARSDYDSAELKETAARIKSKFEEFNVHGSVVQINPGPVVTTYEFKPEAGVKLSRITTLSEDLCLGLQAESIMIERIPGKPTVGIEVPNKRSELIALRQILESDEFRQSPSHLTIAMGKDINGRIKVAALETMPHLLIAGSTGSGKSVMLNAMIMSVLYKSTPDEVRMIMVDPKRVELGIYEGIPHLLTPVITDPKKATNALRNAVLEMERRLKLLALHGVRNIDQFNRKVRQMLAENRGRTLTYAIDGGPEQDLAPLPFVLIIIDELADLMMLERAGVEECVTRLAQMARAVGMHMVLATQRPSVDVITGLIKANFPARISFRVATRVDSRTILDSMGAEHLLGKGDMLFLPPGSSRLVRVHGGYVSESETNSVVDWWKGQATPEYDDTFLKAPPSADDERDGGDDGVEDPMYRDAVRVVCEMGKASTSTLQRRLRLGYGRAARILDMMERDGIIGAPDGSKPREVLKRPGWLDEVEFQ